MEVSEIFGLTLMSIIVLFFAAGFVFIVVDVLKERRKKRAIDNIKRRQMIPFEPVYCRHTIIPYAPTDKEQLAHNYGMVDGDKVGTYDGIVTIVCGNRAKRAIIVATGEESYKFYTLNDCLEDIEYGPGDDVVTVIIEDARRGDVYRYGNELELFWEKVGETIGYY